MATPRTSTMGFQAALRFIAGVAKKWRALHAFGPRDSHKLEVVRKAVGSLVINPSGVPMSKLNL